MQIKMLREGISFIYSLTDDDDDDDDEGGG